MFSFRQAIVYVLLALPAVAQSPAFATITIKRVRSADARDDRLQVLPNGNFIGSAVSVLTLLSYAYDVPANPSPRLSGLPDWTIHERFDIEAKPPVNSIPSGLESNDLRLRVQKMVRALLADRFRLVMRVESKRMSVYALTVAREGPKLRKSTVTDADCTLDTDPEGCHGFIGGLGHPLHARAIDMDDIADYISNWTDLPVVNRTAIGGLFTVSTEGWRPMRLPPPPPNVIPAGNPFAGLPSIDLVLGKLGLKLDRQEVTLPIYTVERVEQPTAN